MDYFIADPAGNITAFVLGEPNARAAERLLSATELGIEQVAFLRPPKLGGHIKCDMAGGEFCGNACRAAGYYYGVKEKLGSASEVIVEMSGADAPVTVTVYPQQGKSFVHLPPPQGMTAIDWDGVRMDVVVFNGIAHVVAPYALHESMELSKARLRQLCRKLNTAALGVMFLSDDNRLKPVVWVDQVESLIWESSCGSGSAACAWWLSRNMARDASCGYREYRFAEPGGELEVKLDRGAEHCDIQVGGQVRLLDHPFWRRLES